VWRCRRAGGSPLSQRRRRCRSRRRGESITARRFGVGVGVTAPLRANRRVAKRYAGFASPGCSGMRLMDDHSARSIATGGCRCGDSLDGLNAGQVPPQGHRARTRQTLRPSAWSPRALCYAAAPLPPRYHGQSATTPPSFRQLSTWLCRACRCVKGVAMDGQDCGVVEGASVFVSGEDLLRCDQRAPLGQ
jgi:hypothetical protein